MPSTVTEVTEDTEKADSLLPLPQVWEATMHHFYYFKKEYASSQGEIRFLKNESISSVQSLSCVKLFVTPWTAAHQASLSITNSWSLLKLKSIEPLMSSNHLILCHPLLLPPSIFPSIRTFSNESVLCIRWPTCWSFSFSITPFNDYSGLISFRMDWLDLLAVQGTLKSLLQHQSLWHSDIYSCLL